MSNDLVNRIRAVRPTVLALSRQDTFLLKAYLDRFPAPLPWYETAYDAEARIGSIGEYTDPDEEALWIHLHATLAYSQGELERLASAEPQPAPSSEQEAMRWIQAIGDETALKIDVIARCKELKGEDKMRAIVKLDSRFIGKNSTEWSTLLGVTPDAVRGYAFWKELRASNKALD
jgi:hypothetical protein